MTKEELQNINDEYEKLVPPTKRESIFKESEDYERLRQYIICQPSIVYQKNKLPFSEVKITSYVEYKKQDVIEKERPNWHIFFLRQSKKGQPDFCDAAGYFIRKTKEFVLLPFSHIITIPLGKVPSGYSRKGEMDGNNLYIKSTITFKSPEEAASYVLGQSAGMDEWIDSRGNGLLAYYKELAFQSTTPETQENKNDIDGGQPSPQTIHIVNIKEDGVCDASGYYDLSSGYFYILKNSKIALNVSSDFAETPTGKARERLIKNRCKEECGYYIVQKDTKCRNATAAACYTVGKDITYVEWESADGKALKDFYPDRFFKKKVHYENEADLFSINLASTIPVQSTTIEDVTNQIFFIKKTKEPGRECDAKGRYDKVTKTFVILSGSTWSFEVTKSYIYTASELIRRNEIKKSCKKTSNEIKQFRDVICDSPSQAASFVLGRVANGWEEWVNKDGHTLKSIYKNVID